MPTISEIKCAELFWKLDSCHLEYRCVVCKEQFYTHSDCFLHIQRCLQLETAATTDGNTVVAASSPDHQQLPKPETHDSTWTPFKEEICEIIPENENAQHVESLEIEFGFPYTSDEPHNTKSEYSDHETHQYEFGDNSTVESSTEQVHCNRKRKSDKIKLKPTHISGTDGTTEEIISADGLKFTQLILANIAKQNAYRKRLKCDICQLRITGRQRMLSHMVRYHGTSSSTDTAGGKKKFCCEICGIQMSIMGNLKVHMRIHSGEKPFPCLFESCDRRFLGSSERKIHMRAHLGEKPFQCDQCSKAFHNKNHLNMHMRTIHSSHRPFGCNECGQSFKLREIYKKHLLTHTGIRPYHCDVCGHSFRQRSAFQVHTNIHTDHRPFMCGYCERGFHSPAARRSHEKKTHKIP